MKRLLRWNRRRRFMKAYTILRKESDRHKDAGHLMTFVANNESYVVMECHACPNLTP